MRPQSRQEPSVTRSTEPSEPGELGEPSQVITLGSFYAILADHRDFDDGFCISKTVKLNYSEFEGYYCKKSGGQSESSEVVFQVTAEKAAFNLNTVLHELITVKVEGSTVKIDLEEYEDIVASANEDV